MENIEKTAVLWKQFKARQKRIYERNYHSDEYHEAQETIRTWPTGRYYLMPPFYMLDSALKKDMYPETIEGLLDWVNDGKKD
jgi:hypothetical protein